LPQDVFATAVGSDDGGSGSVGVSEDARIGTQDEVPPAAAAAAASPPGGRRRTSYTDEEQAVMRELNLSNLANIYGKPLKSGPMRWVVRLSAEGMQRRELWGEFQASCGLDMTRMGNKMSHPPSDMTGHPQRGLVLQHCYRPGRVCCKPCSCAACWAQQMLIGMLQRLPFFISCNITSQLDQ
jgi:hypothetical protein